MQLGDPSTGGRVNARSVREHVPNAGCAALPHRELPPMHSHVLGPLRDADHCRAAWAGQRFVLPPLVHNDGSARSVEGTLPTASVQLGATCGNVSSQRRGALEDLVASETSRRPSDLVAEEIDGGRIPMFAIVDGASPEADVATPLAREAPASYHLVAFHGRAVELKELVHAPKAHEAERGCRGTARRAHRRVRQVTANATFEPGQHVIAVLTLAPEHLRRVVRGVRAKGHAPVACRRGEGDGRHPLLPSGIVHRRDRPPWEFLPDCHMPLQELCGLLELPQFLDGARGGVTPTRFLPLAHPLSILTPRPAHRPHLFFSPICTFRKKDRKREREDEVASLSRTSAAGPSRLRRDLHPTQRRLTSSSGCDLQC